MTLHHALYTNVVHSGPGAGSRTSRGTGAGRGFRLHAVFPVWPAPDRDRLVAWLRALVPANAVDARVPVTAVHSLRLGGTLHACLAVVDGAFGVDGFGRRGVLVHAVMAPLDERAPADDFMGSLLAHQRDVANTLGAEGQVPEKEIASYLACCRTQRTRQPRPLDRDTWLALAPNDVFRLWNHAASRASTTPSAPGSARPIPAVSDPVAWVTAALSLLPPRLRLLFRWRVGRGSSAGTVNLVPDTEMPSEGSGAVPTLDRVDPRVALYDAWLRDGDGMANGTGAPAADWRIRSWDALAEAVVSPAEQTRSSA